MLCYRTEKVVHNITQLDEILSEISIPSNDFFYFETLPYKQLMSLLVKVSRATLAEQTKMSNFRRTVLTGPQFKPRLPKFIIYHDSDNLDY